MEIEEVRKTFCSLDWLLQIEEDLIKWSEENDG